MQDLVTGPRSLCGQPTSRYPAQQLRLVEAASAVAAAHMLLEGSGVWSF